ncbi:hypothetical protein E2C01_072248 [Portunus trituberculatus]|uniref:Uncharacterized protein n=1 Tax=Portunus trituberculatus TaxID=210409 RepID=A0A5B7I244_PORTR|nr:hypothetical protein [Portunus trituberculatus]
MALLRCSAGDIVPFFPHALLCPRSLAAPFPPPLTAQPAITVPALRSLHIAGNLPRMNLQRTDIFHHPPDPFISEWEGRLWRGERERKVNYEEGPDDGGNPKEEVKEEMPGGGKSEYCKQGNEGDE